MERKIKWTVGNGSAAEVTVRLITAHEVNCDGDKAMIPCCKIEICATIDGRTAGYGRPEAVKGHPVAVAKIGKLGIRAEQYPAVIAAIAEVEAAPEYVAHMARVEANRAEIAAHDRAVRRPCPRCGGYCYGDCAAN